MAKYRKKPIVIDAFQYTGPKTKDLVEFMKDATWEFDPFTGVKIATLEGVMTAEPYDFIIIGVQGEYYPCKPNIFQETYDLVEE